MKKSCASVLIGFVICSAAWAAGNVTDGPNANLVYDLASGNVVVDLSDLLDGEVITAFFLSNDTMSLRPENATLPFIDTGTNTTLTVNEIGQGDPLGGNLPSGESFELGEIFPPSIGDSVQLESFLSVAGYGIGSQEFDFDLLVVPEGNHPLGAIGLSLLGVFVYRRRKGDLKPPAGRRATKSRHVGYQVERKCWNRPRVRSIGS